MTTEQNTAEFERLVREKVAIEYEERQIRKGTLNAEQEAEQKAKVDAALEKLKNEDW